MPLPSALCISKSVNYIYRLILAEDPGIGYAELKKLSSESGQFKLFQALAVVYDLG